MPDFLRIYAKQEHLTLGAAETVELIAATVSPQETAVLLGAAGDWEAIQAGVREVRDAARVHLEGLDESDLDIVIPYDGSFAHLRESGLGLRHALLRICAHHYFHIGEIATERSRLGQRVGDYPGPLEECV